MSVYTNEIMPESFPSIKVDRLQWEQKQHEVKYWQDRYLDVVNRFENMINALQKYGEWKITWGNDDHVFTMERITANAPTEGESKG